MLTITVIKLIGFKLCSFTILCIIAIQFFSEAVFISAQASLSSCSTVSDYTTRRLTLLLNVTGYLNLSGKENPSRGQEGCLK